MLGNVELFLYLSHVLRVLGHLVFQPVVQLGGDIIVIGSLLVPFKLHQSGCYLLLQGGLMGIELEDLV